MPLAQQVWAHHERPASVAFNAKQLGCLAGSKFNGGLDERPWQPFPSAIGRLLDE